MESTYKVNEFYSRPEELMKECEKNGLKTDRIIGWSEYIFKHDWKETTTPGQAYMISTVKI